jgi:arabinogalactan endo-1,4-beta-galactosidase
VITLSRRAWLCAPYRPFFQRGVNFTAERGVRYGSEESLDMLAKLPADGVNSIALVPYGFSRRGQAEVRIAGNRGWEADEGIKALARRAHDLKLKVLLKPHIWTNGGFPGDMDFADEATRRAWFAQYALFVEHYAKLASAIRADLFCVGNEFVKLTRHEAEWRALIKTARAHYGGPVTYAAVQGPEFETCKFWNAVDYIGLNNYYPLPDSLDCATVAATIESVQRKFNKPVIFTEAGYSSLTDPHRAPWDESPRALSLEAQARCYEVLLKTFYQRSWFQGIYWWKVGTNGFGGPYDGSHTPWNKPAWKVVSKWYRSGGR